jgi:hypothetical protein
MWSVIKIDKKKFNLFKIEMIKKLGSECRFYAPKIKIVSVRNNRNIEKDFFLLGDYIFCHHEKFNQQNAINQLKSIVGLKYFINNFFFAQNEIKCFVEKCKRMESQDGFIKETLFNIYINKNYKFISGALSGNFFKILELNKTNISILIGSIKAKLDRKKSYLFNPA